MDNFIEFRDQITANDEKLKKMFNISNGRCENNDEVEIVKLDPNKVYESSDEDGEFETSVTEILTTVEIPKQSDSIQHVEPKAIENEIKGQDNQFDGRKKEIFHCKYCDIVFSDKVTCTNHENFAHDPQNPFECLICKLKVSTHPSLIIHIKNEHHSEKPYLCAQCTKTFVRRSDLRKHVFVHAGIRLYNCDQCSKSFTRSTNLAKHKRTHDEAQKTYRCMLCPKAFQNNLLLSHHMEVHMNRNNLNCKFCNQVFTHRHELDAHQKTHLAPTMPRVNEIQPPQHQQPIGLGFYSQIAPSSPPRPQIEERPTINFYSQEQSQLKNDFPIMNQLLSNFKPYKCDRCIESHPSIQLLQSHQQIFHAKNFTCTLCNLSYYKKKELDRHISSHHTDIRFNCAKCPKTFTRKDKLLRHEKIHSAPQFFNCPLCTAVFLRKPLLELHMKIHEMPNINLTPLIPMNLPNAISNVSTETPRLPAGHPIIHPEEAPKKEMPQLIKLPSPISPEEYPMNLSMSKESEPIDLSNEKNKIVIESDDDDLKIIENNLELSAKPNGNFSIHNPPKTDTIMMTDALISGFLPTRDVTSKILEPTRDLPMEILQSPDL